MQQRPPAWVDLAVVDYVCSFDGLVKALLGGSGSFGNSPDVV